MAEKKLSKKALNKSFRNWAYGNLTCFSQEHMQTFGYLCAMLPLVYRFRYGTFKAHHNYKILDIKKAHTRYVLFLYLRWLSYRPYTGIPI